MPLNDKNQETKKQDQIVDVLKTHLKKKGSLFFV